MKHKNTQLNDELLFLITCCKIDPSEDDINFIFSYLNTKDSELSALISLANQHGIFPLVYKTLKNLQPVILDSIGDPQSQSDSSNSSHNTSHITRSTLEHLLIDLKSMYSQIARRNMLMSAELIRIMKLLEENNIEALAFKGPVLAQMAYRDITLRQYSDLDILIHPIDLHKGVKLLEQNGYASAYPLNEQQFKSYRDIAHDYALINKKNNVLTELHWRLLSNEFMADIDTIDFFKDQTNVIIQGKSLKTLQLEELIIYLCIHGAKHQWERLEWLVDIAYLTHTQSINWKRLSDLTYQINSEKMVMSAFYLCRDLLKIDFPHEIEVHLQEPVIQKISKTLQNHFVQHFTDSLNVKVRTKTISLIQFQLLHGWKNKLLFLTSLLKPTELDYLSYPLPSKLTFLYYFIRPVNIIKRWSGKIFNKK